MLLSGWIIALLIVIVLFDFLNGFNDSGDIAASIISSRSMSARSALAMAALAGFAGPFIFGVAVAKTIGAGIIVPHDVTTPMLVAAVTAATAWSVATCLSGIPSSSSHALVGGLVGTAIVTAGFSAILWKGFLAVLASLFLSPLAGLLLGWVNIRLAKYLLRNATPRANLFFKIAQIPAAIAIALGNGANDSQKTIGLLTLGLVTAGYLQEFTVPTWTILLCASAKGVGTFIGGWRVMRTMGTRFYKIKPIHSFSSQVASASVIITSSLFGGPVSTTQVVNMSIVGAGAGERVSKVRWLALRDIFRSWIFTIPVTAALASLILTIINLILK